MRRRTNKKKIRVCVNLDEETYNRSGDYIDNLSAFVNRCIKNYCDACDQKDEGEDDSSRYRRTSRNGHYGKGAPIGRRVSRDPLTAEERRAMEIAAYNWLEN